jgi:hypothetical protein
MSKRLFTGVFFLVSLCFTLGESYACPILKAVIAPPKPHWVIIGTDTSFDGSGSFCSDGWIVECNWTLPSVAYDVDYYTMSHPDDWVACKFGAPGIYTVTLKVKDNLGRTDTDTCTVYVIRLGLGIKDAGERGYVPVNRDDDNHNLTMDDWETGTVTGEDNLVEITLSVEPANLPGQVELFNWHDSYYRGTITVWSNPDKGTLIVPDESAKRWSPAVLPQKLYVEGFNPTGVDEAILLLSYIAPEEQYLSPGTAVCFRVIILLPYYKEHYDPYVYLLDDWPETATQLRSPKYIFGETNPIYVQVNWLGRDPQTAEPRYNFVKVTSTSAGQQWLNMYETGPDSQVFNNSALPGELLYLATDNEPGIGDHIKVVDEEVLTFWMDIQPGSGEYRTCNTVMVDRAEVGVEWQSNYGTYDTYPTLDYSDECAEGFYNNLGTANLVWFKNFDSGDLASKESHWDSGGDSSYADSVDFAFWCGHGTAVSETPRALRFFVDLVGGAKQAADKLLWSEIDWGDKDLDWVVLNTCRFLDGTNDQLKQMVSDTRGVHLICGYVTDMTVYDEAGQYFADRLDEGVSVKQAWFEQGDEFQKEKDQNIARVFGAAECMNDSLAANGPIQTSRDPTSSSTYVYNDWPCY